jgi:hypothetical protein
MQQIGIIINECGVIVRDGQQVVFRREHGGRFLLEAQELRGDLVGRRVAIHGTFVAEQTVLVRRLAPQP